MYCGCCAADVLRLVFGAAVAPAATVVLLARDDICFIPVEALYIRATKYENSPRELSHEEARCTASGDSCLLVFRVIQMRSSRFLAVLLKYRLVIMATSLYNHCLSLCPYHSIQGHEILRLIVQPLAMPLIQHDCVIFILENIFSSQCIWQVTSEPFSPSRVHANPCVILLPATVSHCSTLSSATLTQNYCIICTCLWQSTE